MPAPGAFSARLAHPNKMAPDSRARNGAATVPMIFSLRRHNKQSIMSRRKHTSVLNATLRFFGLLVLVTLALASCSISGGPVADPSVTPAEQEKDLMVDETTEEPMPIRVTVQVSLDVARVLHQQGPPTTESEELLRIVEELGVVLEPIHPGAKDDLLVPYFEVKVSSLAEGEQVIARLQQSEAIEGAYIKPPAELP